MLEGIDVFVCDFYDYVVQVMESIDMIWDMMNGLYDFYFSEISFKMNSIMQVLIIILIIFILLIFLVGIYGMNFEYMLEFYWEYGYFYFWGLMFIISGGFIYYFWR